MATDPWDDDEPATPPAAPANNHDNHSGAAQVSESNGVQEVGAAVKVGHGYDASLTHWKADTPEALLTLMGGDPSGKSRANVVHEIIQLQVRMKRTADKLTGGSAASSGGNGGGGSNQSSGKTGEPAGTKEKGNSPGNCDHGVPREFAQGVNQTTGKPYAGWYCQAKVDRSNKCKPVYVD